MNPIVMYAVVSFFVFLIGVPVGLGVARILGVYAIVRKVHFRDPEMIRQIESKVVNRLDRRAGHQRVKNQPALGRYRPTRAR